MELGTEFIEQAYDKAAEFRLVVKTADGCTHASPSYPIDHMAKAIDDVNHFTSGGVLVMWDCYSQTQMVFGHHNVVWVRFKYTN